MPVVLLMTYRDSEIGPRHPARGLLGDVAARDGLTPLALAPLTVSARRRAPAWHGPGSSRKCTRAHRREPLLRRRGRQGARSSCAGVGARRGPRPHARGLSGGLRGPAARRQQPPTGSTTACCPRLGVDLPSLRRLDATGLLRRTADGIVFRHELARLAIESTIPPGGSPPAARAACSRRWRPWSRRPGGPDPPCRRGPGPSESHDVRPPGCGRGDPRRVPTARPRPSSRSRSSTWGRSSPLSGPQLLVDLAFQQYMTGRLARGHPQRQWRPSRCGSRPATTAGLARAHAAVAIYEYYNARRRQADQHLADRLHPSPRAPETPWSSVTRGVSSAYLAYMSSDDDAVAQSLSDDLPGRAPRADLLRLRRRLVEDVTGPVRGRRRCTCPHARPRRASPATHGFDELASTLYSQLSYLDVEQGRLRCGRARARRSRCPSRWSVTSRSAASGRPASAPGCTWARAAGTPPSRTPSPCC